MIYKQLVKITSANYVCGLLINYDQCGDNVLIIWCASSATYFVIAFEQI